MKNLLTILITIMIGSALDTQAQPHVKSDSVISLNRHDFVRQGTHPFELKVGTYVVVGMAIEKSDAKLMVQQFVKLKYPEPAFGYLTHKSRWYIVYGVADDIDAAKLKRDEYRKYKMYQNAYLLTVHQ